MDKIDFIVTYLDSEDASWRKARTKYSGEPEDEVALNARYRNMNNFQYWFRAVEENAPWVNKIHVVTEGHLPEWLDVDNPKINIVRHSDYIPEEYLPTFNSNTIELNFDRILGLSEKFVNFNDDVFLASPVEKKDFFKNGKPVLQLMNTPILPSEPANVALFNNILAINQAHIKKKLVSLKSFSLRNGTFAVAANLLMTPILLFFRKNVGFRPDHLTQPMTKQAIWKLREQLPKEFHDTSYGKFREYSDITSWLILDYARAVGEFYPHNSFRFGTMLPIGEETDYRKILNSKNKVVCFNDGEATEDFDQEIARLNQALAEKFPNKSSFEL